MSLQDRIQEAVQLAKDERYDEAREIALLLVREYPESPDAWALLSQIVEAPDLVVYCLKKVIELSDNGRIIGWAENRLRELRPEALDEMQDEQFDLYSESTLLKEDFFNHPELAQIAPAVAAPGSAQNRVPTPGFNPLVMGGILLAVVILIGVGSLLIANGVFSPDSGEANISTIVPPTATFTPLATDTPTPTVTPGPSLTPSATPSASATPTTTNTPTITPTPTQTLTPTPTTTPGFPAAPALGAPAPNAVFDSVPLSFAWSTSRDATSYRLIILDRDGQQVFSNTYRESQVCGNDGCTVEGIELENGVYAWQVEASNRLGGVQSNAVVFTVFDPLNFDFELGGQVAGGIGTSTADLMKSTGMTWVKYQITYQNTPPDRVADLVNNGRRNGFKVLLSITGRTYPTAIDFAGYNAYLGQVAALRPDAIEVWNEMNLETEWPVGEISPEQYVNEMLAPAYNTIKAVSPETLVITGALASTGVDNKVTVWSDNSYFDGLYEAGAYNYADCIGTHHNGGATSPLVESGHPADRSGHHSWYFLPTIEVAYEGMRKELPLCITEMGYLSSEGYGPLPQDWLWAQEISAADQAQWLADGVRKSKELGYIRFMVVWNIDFTRYDIDPQGGFAIIRPDGRCPACGTMRSAMEQ